MRKNSRENWVYLGQSILGGLLRLRPHSVARAEYFIIYLTHRAPYLSNWNPTPDPHPDSGPSCVPWRYNQIIITSQQARCVRMSYVIDMSFIMSFISHSWVIPANYCGLRSLYFLQVAIRWRFVVLKVYTQFIYACRNAAVLSSQPRLKLPLGSVLSRQTAFSLRWPRSQLTAPSRSSSSRAQRLVTTARTVHFGKMTVNAIVGIDQVIIKNNKGSACKTRRFNFFHQMHIVLI